MDSMRAATCVTSTRFPPDVWALGIDVAEPSSVPDLRIFLELLEDKGELAGIEASVSLDQESGAVCLRNLAITVRGSCPNARRS